MIVFTRLTILLMLCAQTTTTAPATMPMMDLSSPRSAARSLRVAIERGSVDDAMGCILITDEDQRALAVANVKLIVAAKKLSDAISSRFGTGGDALTAGALLSGDLQEVETSKITLRSDGSATMQLRGSERPLTLRRGNDDAWRVDLLAYANANAGDAAHLSDQMALLDELTTSINEVAADTLRSRFNTLGDVKAALQDRVHTAMARSLRRSQPATQPATNPASRQS